MGKVNGVTEFHFSERVKKKYVKGLLSQISSLRLAMELSQFELILDISHRLRSSASFLGLQQLGYACREMEEACRERIPERVVMLFQVIEEIANRSSAKLQS